jgi:hypothetical protein
MDDRIAALSPGMAEQCLKDFYDQLPAGLFAGGKPSLADLADVADRVREEAPADLRPFIEGVVDAPGSEARGEVARLLLDQFARSPGLQGYVDEALRRAAMPHMALPLIYPAVILALAAMPSKIELGDDGRLKAIEWNQLGKAADFVKALTGFVKALPEGVRSAVAGE